MAKDKRVNCTYIGVSGSAILAAMLSLGKSYSQILTLYDELEQITQGFDWSKNTMDMLLHSTFNVRIFQVQTILYSHIGRVTFNDASTNQDTGLEILSYNLNTGIIETFSNITTPNMEIVKAIILSINMPGYYTVGIYKDNTYIDVTVVNRYPNHVVTYDTGVYINRKYRTCIDAILNAANEQYTICSKDTGIKYVEGVDILTQMINGFFT